MGPDTARADGLIPLEGLSREQRYAEVLAHELAHAVHILGDMRRARELVEIIDPINELLLSTNRQRPREWPGPELCEQIIRRDAVLETMESYAEAMERLVWRELSAGRRGPQ